MSSPSITLYIRYVLLYTASTIGYYYVVNLRFDTECSRVFALYSGDKLVVKLLFNKVDCATTKASTHNSRTCNATLLG